MAFLFSLLGALCALAGFVCFVFVLIKIFQAKQNGLGIACAVLALFGGIGILIAFVVGWVNHAKWNIKNVMLGWSACIVAGILFNALAVTMG